MFNHIKSLLEMFTKTNVRNVGAILTIILSFTCLFILYYHPVPPGNQRLADITTGFVLGTAVAAVYQWLFGSSKNESDSAKRNSQNT